ncbi:NADP-dependent oxidoreductase [Aquabacterium sp. J223]|uniref:NADP-dependent oxidoreductase n=1 Tax=Aquabacterium sp. J223 TaxID=2898431 RepID=UPI0021ADFB85|nr:NADP-dependent oxidoreductase [Aquabacterium sp. J223]UUX97258.1 NADP-dependent oxidoreductase [Aquabacterium sp. J223]
MSTSVNRQFVLASRPEGEPSPANFRLVEQPLPEVGDGQVLVRHHYLSLDPYMRGRMSEGKSYADPQPLDQVMIGGTVGEVVASKNDHFKVGDHVVGMGGWQEYLLVGADQRGVLQKVDTTHVPLSAYLGAVGMPGVTAWYGLVKVIAPKAGETVVVSAASGAVGGVVGQLAKVRGARAVGIAGGADKCRYVVEELGFDGCIDYKQHADARSLAKALREHCPDGIDGYFENVGGMVLDAVMLRANAFSRIAMCGMIAGYNGQPIPMAAPQLILVNRMRIEGFIVSEHMQVWPEALKELGTLVAQGKLKYRESIAQGLESAPEAFIGLLKGRNFGKQLVKLV